MDVVRTWKSCTMNMKVYNIMYIHQFPRGIYSTYYWVQTKHNKLKDNNITKRTQINASNKLFKFANIKDCRLLCYVAVLAEPPTMESARISARSFSEAVCSSWSSGISELPVSCSRHEQSDLAQSWQYSTFVCMWA